MTSFPTTIKALVSTAKKDHPSKFEVVSIPFASREDIKHLERDAVIYKTVAVALNPTDTSSLSTPSTLTHDIPLVVGCDASGVVLEVGSNVKHIKSGDRVASFVFGTTDENNGAFAEVVKSNRKSTWVLSDGMSHLEGAAFTLAHLTAVQALFSRFKLTGRPSSPSTTGETILISGGSTSVGHHAVQIAVLSGYRVLVTASPSSHALLKSYGASETFDYNDPELIDKIKAATKAGKGVKYAYDTSAKENTVAFCIDSIVPEGGQVITTLPVSDTNKTRRSEVDASFQIVYQVLDKELSYYGNVFPHNDDAETTLAWVTTELPALLAGWDSKFGGSKLFKGQKLREEKGGLEGIEAGLQVLKAGTYRAEKLVYSLA